MTDPAIIDMFVEHAMNNEDWIKEMGGDFTVYKPLEVSYPLTAAGPSFPQIPGEEHMVKYNIKGDPDVPPSKRL